MCITVWDLVLLFLYLFLALFRAKLADQYSETQYRFSSTNIISLCRHKMPLSLERYFHVLEEEKKIFF
jgi:hypothetical protein